MTTAEKDEVEALILQIVKEHAPDPLSIPDIEIVGMGQTRQSCGSLCSCSWGSLPLP
jgi:hypothetical protein